MHWSLLVILGATLNALNNLGYKFISANASMMLFTSAVFGLAALGMLVAGLAKKKEPFKVTFAPRTALTMLAIGLSMAAIMNMILHVFAQGAPLSIFDPLYACIYSLASLAIGLTLARERPSKPALAGIALYLAGAILMAQG